MTTVQTAEVAASTTHSGAPSTARFGLATVVGSSGAYPAVMTERGVVSLARLTGDDAPSSLEAMLENWDAQCDAIAAALASESPELDWLAAEEVELAAPISRPSAIYCSGANFYDHIAEMGQNPPDKSAEDAYHFLVPPAALTGHRQPVFRPAGVERLDWEVELVAVIGRRAERVGVDEALEYVAGYTVADDISVRDSNIFHHIFGVRWVPSKGLATMKPMGPAIVPARFVADPMGLGITTHVNGQVRQDSNTEQMIWTVQEQIATLSRGVTLLPGDLILTGTPAGTAAAHGRYLADGDVVTVAVEGIGTLANTIEPTR